MKNIILIDGTSGIWKNDLVTYIENKLIDSTLIIKKTTRKKRASDLKLDLAFLDEDEFIKINFDYIYFYNNKKYGFTKSDINNALERYKNIFIIIRNMDIVKRIYNDFPNENIVTVFIYTDMYKITERLNFKGDKDLALSIEQSLSDYLRTPEMYSLVTINGSSENDFFRLVDYMISYANNTSKNASKKTQRLSINKIKLINICLPLVNGLLTGLAINSITTTINQWNIICFVLTIILIISGIYIQLLINK